MMVMAVLLVASCRKDGVYNPKNQIDKVYNSVVSSVTITLPDGTSNTTDYDSGKQLSETWTWNDDKLSTIEHHVLNIDDWYSFAMTESFSYDDKNRIERVDNFDDKEYVLYKYDGKELSKMEFWHGADQVAVATVTYDDRHIDKISYELDDDFYKNNKSVENSFFMNMMKMFFDDNIIKPFSKFVEKKQFVKGSLMIVVDLDWDGENVEEVEMTSPQAPDMKVEMSFKHDGKLNPKRGLYGLNIFIADVDADVTDTYSMYHCLSKNNVTHAEVAMIYDGDRESMAMDFNYEYDGKFPVKCYYTINDSYEILDASYVSKSVITTFFEYK